MVANSAIMGEEVTASLAPAIKMWFILDKMMKPRPEDLDSSHHEASVKIDMDLFK